MSPNFNLPPGATWRDVEGVRWDDGDDNFEDDDLETNEPQRDEDIE